MLSVLSHCMQSTDSAAASMHVFLHFLRFSRSISNTKRVGLIVRWCNFLVALIVLGAAEKFSFANKTFLSSSLLIGIGIFHFLFHSSQDFA
nr:NBS-LRR protein [Ipomoea trifida]